MIKVNFGCFNSNIDGWIGVDNALRHIIVSKIPFLNWLLWKIGILDNDQYRWHKEGLFKSVKYGDATRKLRFKSSSVDFIYSSHMLEHFYRNDAVFFLKECFRIMKKGATLRICIPEWNSFKEQDSFENSCFAKNKRGLRYSHKWIWTFKELKQVLSNIGFRYICKYKFKED